MLEPLPPAVVPEFEPEAGDELVAVVPDAALLLPGVTEFPAAVELAAAIDGFGEAEEDFLYPVPPHPAIAAVRNRVITAAPCRTEPPLQPLARSCSQRPFREATDASTLEILG